MAARPRTSRSHWNVLVDGARKILRRLNCPQQLPKSFQGVKFTNELEVNATDDHQAQITAACFITSFKKSSHNSLEVILTAVSAPSPANDAGLQIERTDADGNALPLAQSA
jgi:hypothetical protein